MFKTVIRNRLHANTRKNLSLARAEAKGIALLEATNDSYPAILKGDVRRFQKHKQLNAYVGIDIMRYQSGNTFYKDKVNKRGNNKLRKILYDIIQTMITPRKKTKFRQFFWHAQIYF